MAYIHAHWSLPLPEKEPHKLFSLNVVWLSLGVVWGRARKKRGCVRNRSFLPKTSEGSPGTEHLAALKQGHPSGLVCCGCLTVIWKNVQKKREFPPRTRRKVRERLWWRPLGDRPFGNQQTHCQLRGHGSGNQLLTDTQNGVVNGSGVLRACGRCPAPAAELKAVLWLQTPVKSQILEGNYGWHTFELLALYASVNNHLPPSASCTESPGHRI